MKDKVLQGGPEPGFARAEEVVREFPKVGKYRVRLLKTKRGNVLDIREYVESETFEGFTRRGIRLSDDEHLESLRDTLAELLGKDGA